MADLGSAVNCPAGFVCPRPNAGAAWRLFCFPYAGGGLPAFRGWAEGLPTMEVWSAQLPGRGARIHEPPFTRMRPLVEWLAGEIVPLLDRPAAFFGHSLGALAAFELARELRRAGQPMPAHLFLSACGAPHRPAARPPIHALPEAEFLAEVRRLNGTPASLLENDELMRLLLPALRADFAARETYQHRPEPPLDCPCSVFGGSQDARVSRETLDAWREHTTAAFSLQMFPGDHFFAFTDARLVLEAIAAGFH